MSRETKTKLPRVLLVAGAMALCGVGACSVPQPEPGCPVPHGAPFAVKYTLKSGSGPCAELPGETVGFETYAVPGSAERTVAIRARRMGRLLSRVSPDDESARINAVGRVPAEAGPDDFCAIEDLASAKLDLPREDLPDGGAIPEKSIEYRWSNLRLYSTAAAPGTQLVADLELVEDGCTATYGAIGLWPAVPCYSEDEDGNPLPDDSQCEAQADPDAGRFFGSGINPAFPVKCDPDLFLCVLDGEPPALE